jgi:repressor LexA
MFNSKELEMEAVINKIDKLLKEQGKTKKEMADYLEVKPQRLSNWFMRKSIPSEYLIDIAKFLNTTVEALFGESDIIPITRYLPIIGEASCGVPTNHYYQDAEYEMYPVPENLYKEGRYYVRATGDSMLPKIKEGDLVLCDRETYIDNGSIVHYTINNEESGIKKVIMDENGKPVMLMPLNDKYPPIAIKEGDEVRMAKCLEVTSKL